MRAYGSYDGSITNLDFLRHFPTLRRFSADCLFNSLTNIDGLGYLPADVEDLGLGHTRARLSLALLARFKNLTRLFIEGHTKNIDVVGELRRLRSITLRSVTLPSLAVLTPLQDLRALDLKLGGTRNLELLPQVGQLEYLEIWMVKGLSDLSPLADLPKLEFLFLQSLRQVTSLPAMSRLASLRRVWLENLKGLSDFTPLLEAPVLEQLAIVDMAHLQPEDVHPLADHRSLRSIRIGLGSKRKNEAAKQLVPLGQEADWAKPRYRRRLTVRSSRDTGYALRQSR